ncbi:MAG TPA: GNAT family N-acetyltransferase [Micromonosporaceae bacterium]|nr:GNAT family N-acetyltransferase [Micromonosporaceae bacterium]
MSPTELPIRPGVPEDWDAISRLLFTAFNDTFDDELNAVERGIYEPERALLVIDGEEVVGNAAAFTRDLTVPGAVVPAAHVTMVAVAPTHRRRGLLRRLMHRQLHEVRDAGREPIAVLWASEGRIYQRFGYGMATARVSFEIDAREVRLSDPVAASAPVRLRGADPATARTELSKVYEQLRADRPGWSSRDERWWEYVLSDVPSRRQGATERRAILHEGQSGVDGYALWRAKGGWESGGPEGQVLAGEVVATNPTAYVNLWRFLLSVDLTRSARFWFGTTDEPLLWLANEPRRLGARLGDGLWVRIVDLPAALSARRYAAPVDVVIEVADGILAGNAGTWRLRADASGAGECTRTDAPAELACDVSVLGAAYLGGTSIGALAVAGRVRELRPGAVAAASAAFGWHRAPSGIEIF